MLYNITAECIRDDGAQKKCILVHRENRDRLPCVPGCIY